MITFAVGIHDGVGLAAPQWVRGLKQIESAHVLGKRRQYIPKILDGNTGLEIETGQHVEHKTPPVMRRF